MGGELPAGYWGFSGVGRAAGVPWAIKQDFLGAVRRRVQVKFRGVRVMEGFIAWTTFRASARTVLGGCSGREGGVVMRVTSRLGSLGGHSDGWGCVRESRAH